MKKFSQYLTEYKRNYRYNVKLAFKPDSDTMQKIEQAMQRYSLVSITAPKSLPIQKTDKSFPGMNSPETYLFSVEVEYPASQDMIRKVIADMGMDFQSVAVSNLEFDLSQEQEMAALANMNGKTLIGSDYEPQDNKAISKANYGNEFVKDFVNNLETGKMVPEKFKKEKAENFNDLPAGTKSPVGSTKNYKPEIKSFAR